MSARGHSPCQAAWGLSSPQENCYRLSMRPRYAIAASLHFSPPYGRSMREKSRDWCLVFRENPNGPVAGAEDERTAARGAPCRSCRAIAAPCRATTRRKAATGRHEGTGRRTIFFGEPWRTIVNHGELENSNLPAGAVAQGQFFCREIVGNSGKSWVGKHKSRDWCLVFRVS